MLELGERLGLSERALIDVEDVQERLRRQEVEVVKRIEVELTCCGDDGATLVEHLTGGLDRRDQRGELGILTGLLLELRQPGVDRLEVRQDQLGVDGLDVRHGVDRTVDMDHIVVDEGAHDLANRIGLSNRGQELVAETFAFRCATHDPRDVDEGDRGGQDPFRAEDPSEDGKPRVGDGDHANVRLDGGKGVVGRKDLVLGQGIEQGGLAHIGQTDDSDGQTHEASWGRVTLRGYETDGP